jgi:hypothetical protein
VLNELAWWSRHGCAAHNPAIEKALQPSTDGRAHAAPTLFTLSGEAFWLPTLGNAARVRNLRAQPWLALSIVEGEHETHAAVLAEGPAEVLTAAPQSVWEMTRLRNQGDRLDWATAWLRMTPARLLSFAEVEWAGAPATP